MEDDYDQVIKNHVEGQAMLRESVRLSSKEVSTEIKKKQIVK